MDSSAAFSTGLLLSDLSQSLRSVAVLSVRGFRIKTANASYMRMVGKSALELLGRPLFDIMPDLRSPAQPIFDEVIREQKTGALRGVSVTIARNGLVEKACLDFICEPLFNSNGVVEGIMVLATERHDPPVLEDKFRMVVDQSPVPMAIIEVTDWKIGEANRAMRRILLRGEAEHLKGRKLLDVFPDPGKQVLASALEQVYAAHEPHSEKQILICPNGSSCEYIDFECTPLIHSRGSLAGILLTVQDVSEQVRAKKGAAQNEDRLRTVIEASGLGTWQLDLKTGDFSYSAEYLSNFGTSKRLSHSELIGFIHPEDLPVRQQAFEEAVRTGRLHYVSRIVWPDGSLHWIEAHGKIIRDREGRPARMLGTSRDITEEKRFQHSIQESERKFRMFANSMHQLIWTTNADGALNYFNQSVYSYSGSDFEALRGEGWFNLLFRDDRPATIRKWLEAEKKGANFDVEHRLRRHDGVYRWHLSRAMPHHDSEGRIQMWVGTSTDIHDQKTFAKELEEKVQERTKQLKETNETLAKTNHELEQFAYIASHDLQEPLRKIQTFADILKRNINDQDCVQKYFSKIDSSAQRMADLIKSVLEYSRIPAHPAQLHLTDLNEVCEYVISDLELTILEKRARVEYDRLPAVPGVPLQLQQLFSNLIGNALKFCREDPMVSIKARSVPGYHLTHLFNADKSKQYAELQFRDNGIGFERKYKEQIFTIFQRLHGLQQYAGTGIGLALCKKIVENHLGHIIAESEPGKGANFIVYLPA